MVWYFDKDLKPSIKTKIDQDATQLDDDEELVTTVLKAEAKTSLQPSFYVRETDFLVAQGSWLAHTTAHIV